MVTFKVGLEIHGYINTKQKLFCNCAIEDEAEPNTNCCPVCTGQPGSKPMLTNQQAVTNAINIGLMLGCKINNRLLFQRKHYSWPDSPNNYQRTMSGSYAVPVGEKGEFEGIRITQVHLEEDPAKWDPVTGEIDYNRAGFPLIEIVTEPDFHDSEQVREWLKKLVTTLSYIKALNRKAGIKSDVNVSIEPEYERAEIKNVNSQSAIVDAIEIEVKRQVEEKAAGNKIPMQTRTYDGENKTTVFMRSKETAEEYMFIPDPDIPFIDISDDEINVLKDKLPESPSVKLAKLIEMGVKEEDAKVLAEEFTLIELYEKFSKDIPLKILTTYLRREVVGVANYNKVEVSDLHFDETQLKVLLTLVKDKKLTDPVAKKLLETLLLKPFDIMEHVEKEGLLSVQDDSQLETWCTESISENPKAVEDYKGGEEKSLNFLVGQVMKKSRGTAAPDVIRDMIKGMLE